MSPRISVAIPTLGRETLMATLRSLERQTVLPFEVIVVNQGDPSLASRLSTDLRLHVLHQTVRGLSRARNAAIACFSGDWIAFIDDDEEANAEWVEQIGLAIESRPNIDFLGGVYFPPVGYQPADGFCSELYALGEQILDTNTWLRSMGHPLLQRDCWGGNSAYSRACIGKVGGYDEWLGRGAPDFTCGEDTDLNIRALSAGLVGLLSARIIIYHTYGTRPYSDDFAKEMAILGGALAWKASQDPERIRPDLTLRLKPFGAKKEFVSRITGGRVFSDHALYKKFYEAAFELLDRQYTLRNGLLHKGDLA